MYNLDLTILTQIIAVRIGKLLERTLKIVFGEKQLRTKVRAVKRYGKTNRRKFLSFASTLPFRSNSTAAKPKREGYYCISLTRQKKVNQAKKKCQVTQFLLFFQQLAIGPCLIPVECFNCLVKFLLFLCCVVCLSKIE